MGDKLEKFIYDNRNAFDDEAPSEKVWTKIKSQLPVQKGQNLWWKVAAIVFFCTTSVLLWQNYSVPSKVSVNELSELEDYFFTQIDYKKSLVNDLHKSNTDIENVNEELEKLHAMYLVLKEEWRKKPSKEVLEALSLNLLIRLDLLNRQLASFEKDSKTNDRSI